MKRAIAVLSASVKKNEEGKWISTGFEDGDFGLGAPGGQLRVWAACYLNKKNPDRKIISSGGRGWDVKNDETSRPNLSAILRDELLELGVGHENVIEENRSNKTFEQLIEIDKMIEDGLFREVTIVTNRYHVGRVCVMVEVLKQIKNKKRFEVVAAEDICLEFDTNKWRSLIEKAYSSDELKKIIKKEEQGQQDMKLGRYDFNLK